MTNLVIPEYITDAVGNKVFPGDIIAYGVLLGRSATLSLGWVTEFTLTKGYNPSIKIKVLGTEEDWSSKNKGLKYKNPGYLEASYKRFVLLPKDQYEQFMPPREIK